ncbi:ethanolamine ammonia-lyase subunit EutC [Halothiobacillus sp.]|uniref:ethanolamine ammonia-lyase subunit EutC n=1 Tax=Halothiobacillus sp. TaxID=1891311 RepID=UPI002611FBC8|nr:ethanolamine ammonia-lyase subunit EutC [Halothiobacillus sp.]
MKTLVQHNPWEELRRYTRARIALGNVGASLPTDEVLRFGLAHAKARDAVHHAMDVETLRQNLEAAGFRVLRAQSTAADRQTYLLRPDLGRRLHPDSVLTLQGNQACSLAIVVADGLSAFAPENHTVPLLRQLQQRIDVDWSQVPVVLTTQGRVAIGDEIGAALKADLVLVLIGERPGLSSPDSLGAYLTYQPKLGRMDSERNCVSNIHAAGMSYAQAAHKISYLIQESLRRKYTGVELKDDSDTAPLPIPDQEKALLMPSSD